MDTPIIEDSKTEFKQCERGRVPKGLLQTVVAFANSEGGIILVGVDEDGRSINLSSHHLDKLQTDIASQCMSCFNTIITPEIVKANRHLKIVIRPASVHQRPVYIKRQGLQRGSYIRVGSSNQVATDQVLSSLMVAAQGGAEQRIFKNQSHDYNFDRGRVKEYIEGLNQKHANIYQRFAVDEILAKIRATNTDGDVSMFGLLAFARERRLQELVSPAIRIEVTTYTGPEKTNRIDAKETHSDSQAFTGNTTDQFRAALAYITRSVPSRGLIHPETGFRQEIQKMPLIVIREVLVNSLVHRDYAVAGGKIDVEIYSDRLEITNPGTSLVPIDQLEATNSLTRNPLLMSFFKDIGLAEEKARGIRTIKEVLKESNLKQPLFENLFGQFFRVTLFSSLLTPVEDMVWLNRLAGLDLLQNQINALLVLKHGQYQNLTNTNYRHINNMNKSGDDIKARNELMRLVNTSLLRPIGQNRGRSYALTPWLKNLIEDSENKEATSQSS